MWLATRLRNALEGFQKAKVLSDEVTELRRQVERLDSQQLEREMEWQEAREAIYRNLKRMQALKQHGKDPEADGYARAQQLARTLKFPNAQEG